MSSMFTIGINEDYSEENMYKELLDEATDLIMEGMDTDLKFHFNSELLLDQGKVKELCKVIEDDMTNPTLRNFLVNKFVLLLWSSIGLPGMISSGSIIYTSVFLGILGCMQVRYSYKRHDHFIKIIDKATKLLEKNKFNIGEAETKRRLDLLVKSRKILIEAKDKYKKLEAEDRKNLGNHLLKKFVGVY